MFTLAEDVLGKEKSQNLWPLQVIQQSLALLSNLPIRLWDPKKAHDSMKHATENRHCARNLWLQAGEDIRSFFGRLLDRHLDLVTYYSDRHNSAYLTLPCNPHPLVTCLRQHRLWLAWEHCLMTRWLSQSSNDWPVIEEYGVKSLQMAAIPLNLWDGKRVFLVIGPLVVLPWGGSGERSLRGEVEKFAASIVENVHQAICNFRPCLQENDSSKDSPFCVSQKILAADVDFGELVRLGCSRGWMTEKSLKEVTRNLGRIMQSIFDIDCTDLRECSDLPGGRDMISNSDLNAIAQVAFMLHPDRFLLRDLTEEFIPDLKHYFKIGMPSDPHQETIAPARNHVIEGVIDGKQHWKLALKRRKEPATQQVWVDGGDEEYTFGMGFLRNKIGVDSAVRFERFGSERLRHLVRWMDYQYGVVSNRLKSSISSSIALGNFLAQPKLADLVKRVEKGIDVVASMLREVRKDGVRHAQMLENAKKLSEGLWSEVNYGLAGSDKHEAKNVKMGVAKVLTALDNLLREIDRHESILHDCVDEAERVERDSAKFTKAVRAECRDSDLQPYQRHCGILNR